MAKTQSLMVELGFEAPDFFLPEVRGGGKVGLWDVMGGAGLLVMFVCRHCPYVQHVKKQIGRLAADYQDRIRFVAISSNDAHMYPEDRPESLAQMATEEGWLFPLLFDETQEVARAYQATCTPDFFLFDRKATLVYRGQMDDSRPGNGIPNDAKDLRAAMDALYSGKPISSNQRPSLGCNIKWKV